MYLDGKTKYMLGMHGSKAFSDKEEKEEQEVEVLAKVVINSWGIDGERAERALQDTKMVCKLYRKGQIDERMAQLMMGLIGEGEDLDELFNSFVGE